MSPLATPAAAASAALILWNDLWLKHHHPGLVSGKLSDVALCIFLPLFVAALLEPLTGRFMRAALVASLVAAAYFVAVKTVPAATHAHVAWLTWLVPSRHFAAVTDPTDLVCLPAGLVAWGALRRRSIERNDEGARPGAPL